MRHTDWTYHGAQRALCLYVESGTNAGAAMATTAFVSGPPERITERVTAGDGTLLTSAAGWRYAPVVYGGAALAWLEAMEGSPVRALVLGRGPARHLRWQEPVPVLLDREGGGSENGLAGARLTLETHASDAAVYEYPDLLAPAAFESGGDWTVENAGTGSGWSTGTDPLTGLPAPRYTLHADAGETATLWAQCVLPAVGAFGPAEADGPGRLPLNFLCRMEGAETVLDNDATVTLSITSLTYADRAATQASVLSGATTPAGRSTEPVVEAEPDDGAQDEDVEATHAEGAWVARVAIEVTADAGGASGGLTVYAPTLLTRNGDGATLTPGGAQAGTSGLKMGRDGTTLYVYDPASVASQTPNVNTIVVPETSVIRAVSSD